MSMPGIAAPISVARSVMVKCPHSILTESGALSWAKKMGFEEQNIVTGDVMKEWEQWLQDKQKQQEGPRVDDDMHDTIGVVCIDREGRLAAGTSTSGYALN